MELAASGSISVYIQYKMATTSSSSTSKAMGSKRGYGGACSVCHNEYTNRKKPKVCDCGNEIGGSFVEKVEITYCPASVEIYKTEQSSFRSVRVTPNDDRSFVYVEKENQMCYSMHPFASSKVSCNCVSSSLASILRKFR